MVEIVWPTPAHVDDLVANLRKADRAELVASGHTDAHRAITMSLSLSTHSLAALVDGRVGAILGVVPISMATGDGCPWMLGTDLVTSHGRALMAHTPPYIAAMLRTYPHLTNIVHAENTFAVRWLRRVGFEIHPAQPHPRTGVPFHRFEMRA